MPYRFVHAADIHLDSPLKSLALRDAELAELMGNATRRAFVGIIDLCLSERVDALLLSGDLYDGDQRSMKTARFLAEQIHRLHQAGVATYIIRGNHDAESRITKELTFPGSSVKVFGGRAEVVTATPAGGAVAVAIHGLSFSQPQAPDSLLPRFRPPVEGALNIALLHTSLGGTPGHDIYAPCSARELDSSGFNYWALGHIHKRAVYQGQATIVMPGIPQGRDINEAGPKSVTLATILDDRSIHIEERFTSVAQFEVIAIDLTGIEEWQAVVSAVSTQIQRVRDRVISEHLVARLRFVGSTPLAWRLRRDPDMLKAEAMHKAFIIGKSWIEKIEIDCRDSAVTVSAVADPVIDLHRIINDNVLGSEAYRVEITSIADELLTQLPPDCRDILGRDETAVRTVVEHLARDSVEDIIARLRASNGIGDV